MQPAGGVRFEERTRRSQVHHVRAVALDALADFPVEASRVRLVHHAHNTTFRVDTADGRRFALRVNVNSRSTSANLLAETAWLTALSDDTDVAVPVPLMTRQGGFHTSRYSEDLGRELSVVMMSWLPGRHLDPLTPTAVRELGRLTAALHDHAATWTPPAGAGFPSHASVLVDDPNRIQSDHPLLTEHHHEVVAAALSATQARFDEMHASSPSHCLHADLHGGNLKWRRRRPEVFDFDDAVTGPPLLDLGISSYYLGTDHELDAALFAGYAAHRALGDHDEAHFQAVLAGRNLLLLNEVLGAVTADIRAFRRRYVDNSMIKLTAYLDTGIYRHDVPGVVPLGF